MSPKQLISKYYGNSSPESKGQSPKPSSDPRRTTSSYNYMPSLESEDYLQPARTRWTAGRV